MIGPDLGRRLICWLMAALLALPSATPAVAQDEALADDDDNDLETCADKNFCSARLAYVIRSLDTLADRYVASSTKRRRDLGGARSRALQTTNYDVLPGRPRPAEAPGMSEFFNPGCVRVSTGVDPRSGDTGNASGFAI